MSDRAGLAAAADHLLLELAVEDDLVARARRLVAAAVELDTVWKREMQEEAQ